MQLAIAVDYTTCFLLSYLWPFIGTAWCMKPYLPCKGKLTKTKAKVKLLGM